MKYIANVITSSKGEKYGTFIHVSKDKEGLDMSLPTLIVGYERSKSFSDNLDFTDRKINENLYWTFAYNERRSEYEDDVNRFFLDIRNRVKNNTRYVFFNVLTEDLSRIKSFVRFLRNDVYKYYYITDNMLYISYEDTVIGVSINDCEYIGIKRGKLIEKIKSELNGKVSIGRGFMNKNDIMIFGNEDVISSILYCYKG